MMPFALELNFLIEEYAGEKGHFPPIKRRKKNTLYVCTTEKAHSIINCLIESNRMNEVTIARDAFPVGQVNTFSFLHSVRDCSD